MPKDFIKTEDEISRLRESGKRLALVLARVTDALQRGMTTKEIDVLAESLIREAGGIPVFKGYNAGSGRPFPATLCTSINNEVVHGIPSATRKIQEGDLLKLDIGMRFEGMVSDMARTIAIGTISDAAQKLLDVTRECLSRGIAKVRPGVLMSVYASTVQEYVEANGFSVVRDLVGHGVGRELHEEPQVPNFTSPHIPDVIFQKGMTLALEPMINAGGFAVRIAPDDWTFITADGKLSAHFEDTIVITKDGAEILTRG